MLSLKVTPHPFYFSSTHTHTMKYFQLGSILALCSVAFAAAIPDASVTGTSACIKQGGGPRKPIVPGTECGDFP